MKNYRVNVNGNIYNVTVEEIGGQPVPTVMPAVAAAPATAPSVSAAPAPAPPKTSGAAGANKVESPMPGTIVGVKVKVGDTVSKNQTVAILEAMKMENEIVSTVAGTVATVEVAAGASVNTGDVIITLN